MKHPQRYWRIAGPACAAIALATLTSGLSDGPVAFLSGFGIGLFAAAALAQTVVALK